MNFSSIDIFCHRIDNFGDVGVAYRFAKELKRARPLLRIRVFIDDLEALSAITAGIDPQKNSQELGGIVYINPLSLDDGAIDALGVADVMVETFACHIPEKLMEKAYDNSKLIINLEYLSAEDWVESYHLKESLLGRGTVRKFYFMPGFREGTGGLILNSLLEETRGGGIDIRDIADIGDIGGGALVGTVFTYERGFDTLIGGLAGYGGDAVLMVFGEKSRRGMAATLERIGVNSSGGDHRYGNIRIIYMPFIEQHLYDTLLCLTDFNIVRGEDSLARAVLSGKPFIWNAYIQDEKYQLVKVEALLKTMRPFYGGKSGIFEDYRELMMKFNDIPSESSSQVTSERYDIFFKNLKKHERAARAIYYIMKRNHNLIKKFYDFLDQY